MRMTSGDRSVGNTSNGVPTILRPTRYLKAEGDTKSSERAPSTALIILNSPIEDFELLRRLYSHASYRICADGGANRLHNLLTSHFKSAPWKDALRAATPNAIYGDLDSLSAKVRERYEEIGVEICRDPDQYSTDLGKCIKKVTKEVSSVKDVLVLGSLGGRIDQGIGLLHELYREQKFGHSSVRFWFVSEASISVILRPGTTIIHTPLKQGLITRNVGILPLYGRASITIEGFEWDVQNWATEMGGQLSTSNHIVADEVSITTDADVLFTIERQTLG